MAAMKVEAGASFIPATAIFSTEIQFVRKFREQNCKGKQPEFSSSFRVDALNALFDLSRLIMILTFPLKKSYFPRI